MDFMDITDEQLLKEVNKRGLLEKIGAPGIKNVPTNAMLSELGDRHYAMIFLGRVNLDDNPLGKFMLRPAIKGDLFVCGGLSNCIAAYISNEIDLKTGGSFLPQSAPLVDVPGKTGSPFKDGHNNIRIT